MSVSPTVCGFRKPSYGDSIFAGGKQVPRQKKLTSTTRIEVQGIGMRLSDFAELGETRIHGNEIGGLGANAAKSIIV